MGIQNGWGSGAPAPHEFLGGLPPSRVWGVATAAALLVVGVVHVLCWAPFPNDVDPMNFVAALRGFDVLHDAPHAPGYPLYVGAARLARALVGEMHAYQCVNLLCVLLMGAAGFVALASLARPALGFAWACVGATHPLVWAATIVQESYITDATAATCVVAAAVLLRRRSDLAAALGVGVCVLAQGLLRPVSAAMLQPLAVGSLALLGVAPSLRRALIGLGVSALAIILAYVVVVACGGGHERYTAATRSVMLASFRASSVLAGAPPSAHAAMIVKYLAWLGVLGGVPVLLALAAWRRSRRSPAHPGARAGAASDPTTRWRWTCVGILWFAPPAGVYLLFYYLKPTYHLVYLPLLLALGIGGLWVLVGRRGRALAGIAVAMALVQLAFFLFAGRLGLPEQVHRLTLRGVHAPANEVGRFLHAAQDLPEHAAVLLLPGRPLPGGARSVRLVQRDLAAFELAQAEDATPDRYRAIARFDPVRWVPEVLSPALHDLPRDIDEVLVVGRLGGRLVLSRAAVPMDRSFTGAVRAAGW